MRSRLASFLFLLFVVACASPAGGARELPKEAATWLRPSATFAARGGAEDALSKENAEVRATFEKLVGDPNKVHHDPRLDGVAAVLARSYFEERASMPWATIEWLFWKVGSSAVPFRRWTAWARGKAMYRATTLDDYLGEYARVVALHPGLFVYGVARMEAEGHHAVQALVVGRVAMDVEPVAKAAAPGATVTIHGKLDPSFVDPVLYADGAGDEVVTRKLDVGPGGAVDVVQALPSTPGRHYVEVVARDASATYPATSTVLLLPFDAGTPELAEPDAFIRAAPANPPDASTWSASLLAAFNAERAKRGLAPIATDARLDAVAAKRAKIRAESKGPPPDDARLGEELAVAGMSPNEYFEHKELFDRVSTYVARRLLDPAGRARFLAKDPPLLAFGVAALPPSDNGIVDYELVEDWAKPAR